MTELDRHYDELRVAARQRLGDLFDPTDYPGSLEGLFVIEHDYPSVEPPPDLRQLSPELYDRECQRAQARFDEALQLAEQAFLDELARIVEHLTERLSGQSDGKPKVFRDSAITIITDFFDRFRRLNVRSNEQLDDLVHNAQQIVRGVEPQQLCDDQSLRQRVSTHMTALQSHLDQLLVDRPRPSSAQHSATASLNGDAMQLVIEPIGTIHCLYDEELNLRVFGPVRISQGSHVEPTGDGQWLADLAPVRGPVLGPFSHRSDALHAERQWLEQHWLRLTCNRRVTERSPATAGGQWCFSLDIRRSE